MATFQHFIHTVAEKIRLTLILFGRPHHPATQSWYGGLWVPYSVCEEQKFELWCSTRHRVIRRLLTKHMLLSIYGHNVFRDGLHICAVFGFSLTSVECAQFWPSTDRKHTPPKVPSCTCFVGAPYGDSLLWLARLSVLFANKRVVEKDERATFELFQVRLSVMLICALRWAIPLGSKDPDLLQAWPSATEGQRVCVGVINHHEVTGV